MDRTDGGLPGGAVVVGESQDRLRATITTSAGGYTLALDIDVAGTREQRTLESIDCDGRAALPLKKKSTRSRDTPRQPPSSGMTPKGHPK